MTSQNTPIGAEAAYWDLSCLYQGLDDPQIDADVKSLVALLQAFQADHKGKLAIKLGSAIDGQREIKMLASKIFYYPMLILSLDTGNQAAKAKNAEIEKTLYPAIAEYQAFFDIELAGLDQARIDELAARDGNVARHLPWIREIRKFKPHLLTEEVEAALGKRAAFGPGSWSEFYDEFESDLRFALEGGEKTLTEISHLLSEEKSPERRALIMKTMNDGLKGHFAKFSAQTLFMVSGSKALEDRERGYARPMTRQNMQNMVPDRVVEALHQAVSDVAGPITRDYFKLKGEILGIRPLRWCDRNAPLPFADTSVVPFADAREIVFDSYRSFSPKLAEIVTRFFDEKRIDAHVTKGRRGGGYNASGVFPGSAARSFTFLNYLGSRRDVMTMAHEFGHGVHGILSGEAQGPLMAEPPIAYCETASIFGEMLTFDRLRSKIGPSDTDAALALVTGKIEDMMNSVVRQTSFSNFERRIHGDGQKRSVEELCAIWREETIRLYGPEGEAFRYEDMEHLWAYIPHFHRPFYVYGYAFGELLTQSLYAKKDAYGAKFEPMYIGLLQAGGTKDAKELLAPFGLDPENPDFWADGIKNSLGRMVEEAKKLWSERKP
jgi:oligoendopeptidase F